MGLGMWGLVRAMLFICHTNFFINLRYICNIYVIFANVHVLSWLIFVSSILTNIYLSFWPSRFVLLYSHVWVYFRCWIRYESIHTKNVSFLRYFYTCFMLVIIVFLRFLFDFISFCRFWINVEKCKEIREKDDGNAGNGKLDQMDSNSTQKSFCCLAQREKKREIKI